MNVLLRRVRPPAAPLVRRSVERLEVSVTASGVPELRLERSAGLLITDPSTTPPRYLPGIADFSRNGGDGSAFWLLRDPTRTGIVWKLYRASPAVVLRDVRDVVGRVRSLGSLNVWDLSVTGAISDKLRAMTPPGRVPADNPPEFMSAEWLRAALLATYGQDGNTIEDVKLAATTLVPDLGGDPWPVPPQQTVALTNADFVPSSLTANPFAGTGGSLGPERHVVTTTGESSSAGPVLVLLGLLGLAAMGGK